VGVGTTLAPVNVGSEILCEYYENFVDEFR
jgi:hypothetical protein